MNLFNIRGGDGKVVKESGVFTSKEVAKAARDELNGGKPADLAKTDKKPKFFVCKGADHIHYNS